MKKIIITLATGMLLTLNANSISSQLQSKGLIVETKPISLNDSKIQLAILLDTSGSMQGLINQVKTEIWQIINELSSAKKNGNKVKIEVALYEYGKSTISQSENFLRMITPLSSDLDILSKELFKLKTNGGEEWAGAAITSATNGLQWSKNPGDLRMVVIAGNESFAQGPLNYQYAITNLSKKDIVLNTIFCGNYNSGKTLFWRDAANLGNGQYMNIDSNQEIAYFKAPQDSRIIALNDKLNKTYLSYGGRRGVERKKLQIQQDVNTESMNSSLLVERSIAKASKSYDNSSWDIIDSFKSTGSLSSISENDMPEELKKLNKEDQIAVIKEKEKERKSINKEIEKLKKERTDYLKTKKTTKTTFGDKFLKSTKKLLTLKGFS